MNNTLVYKRHSKKEVLDKLINDRMKKYPLVKSKSYFTIFDFGCYSFMTVTMPSKEKKYNDLHDVHFEFYALSEGFEMLTSTGYRSEYTYTKKGFLSTQDIKSFWINELKSKGLDLESNNLSRQTTLFEF